MPAIGFAKGLLPKIVMDRSRSRSGSDPATSRADQGPAGNSQCGLRTPGPPLFELSFDDGGRPENCALRARPVLIKHTSGKALNASLREAPLCGRIGS